MKNSNYLSKSTKKGGHKQYVLQSKRSKRKGENDEEYRQVQRQRQKERQIRKEKTQAKMLEAAGDKEGAKKYRKKASEHNKKLRAYCEENGLSYREDRTRTYGYKKAGKTVDKSAKGGIINSGSGKVTISSIETPIEQRNTGKGNPNAILHFDVELNNRQSKILKQLSEYNSRVIVPKNSVNMADLSALTAKTGDEFAMFTKGGERLVIRGNTVSVDIDVEMASRLAADGYRWSGHTHPGLDFLTMQPSDGDYAILNCFSQKNSVIYNSKGEFRTFEKRS